MVYLLCLHSHIKTFFPVYCPMLASLLQKLGFSFDLFNKEQTDFFANVTKQAIEIRKADDDQVSG